MENLYQPKGQLYNVHFADRPGLEILAKGTKIARLLQLQGMKLDLNEQDDSKKLAAFKYFSSRIVRWNMAHPELEEDEVAEDGHCFACGQFPGDPMVPSVQSLLCLEVSDVMGIIFGYMSAVAQVSQGKENNSNDGAGRIQEESMRRLAELQSQSISLPQSFFSDALSGSDTVT